MRIYLFEDEFKIFSLMLVGFLFSSSSFFLSFFFLGVGWWWNLFWFVRRLCSMVEVY